jgi:hypothetical protein
MQHALPAQRSSAVGEVEPVTSRSHRARCASQVSAVSSERRHAAPESAGGPPPNAHISRSLAPRIARKLSRLRRPFSAELFILSAPQGFHRVLTSHRRKHGHVAVDTRPLTLKLCLSSPPTLSIRVGGLDSPCTLLRARMTSSTMGYGRAYRRSRRNWEGQPCLDLPHYLSNRRCEFFPSFRHQ